LDSQLYTLIQELLCPAGKLLVCAKAIRLGMREGDPRVRASIRKLTRVCAIHASMRKLSSSLTEVKEILAQAGAGMRETAQDNDQEGA
jgi:hypothetical protein